MPVRIFCGCPAADSRPAGSRAMVCSGNSSRSGAQPMTRPAGTDATPAPPAGRHDVSLRAALADPRARLGVGIAALLATAGAVRHYRVSPWEARAFQDVNGLPDALYPPAWAVMQMGAFGAVPAA